MPLKAAKAIITVQAGILLREPMNEYFKRWDYDSEQRARDEQTPQDQPTIFSKMIDEAYDYAKGLSNPGYVNWVRVDWIWL